MMYYSHDGGWWLLMCITSTIFWLALIGGLVALLVYVLRPPEERRTFQEPSARAILEERFARGEISQEEFEERLRTIGGGGTFAGTAA